METNVTINLYDRNSFVPPSHIDVSEVHDKEFLREMGSFTVYPLTKSGEHFLQKELGTIKPFEKFNHSFDVHIPCESEINIPISNIITFEGSVSFKTVFGLYEFLRLDEHDLNIE